MSEESHLVFARKYRPQLFKEVIHQDLAIGALMNALKNNRVGHAYIFFGPRGVGKTTIARLLAKRLNCESPEDNEPCNKCKSCTEIMKGISNDVLEIDAASNRGIDNIRDLRENVKFSPMGGRYKIYIIDEVHMLTDQSFNALLKTLEEPPHHVVFILATTEFHKIPETILSRCQDFVFKKVPLPNLQSYVEHLCKIEKIDYDADGIFWVAKKGDGSVRDTLSFLEQAVTFTDGHITGKQIGKMIGYQGVEVQIEFLKSILGEKTFHKSFEMIEKIYNEGTDLHKFAWEFVEFTHALIIIKENLADRDTLNYPIEDIEKISKELEPFSVEVLTLLSEKIYSMYEKLMYLKLRNSFEMKIFIEISIRKLIFDMNKPSVAGVLEKIHDLYQILQKEGERYTASPRQSNPVAAKENLPQKGNTEVLQKEEIDVESILKDKFLGTEVDSSKLPEI
ncbi:MAG TPA: DNA polymerase III subunit gamma/tau [Leptospiraceae bacterium]|nr:DNA polymerase III subunit gamma/tau [Leptospiraceae bacterium]HMW05756.1 DNA polymerase III subunit gamma/tau [Leptospiraceae bacterium]HMX33862.1 DNA polymerase III subunit gamma/tau [Leptospiraceae bacterium]HMY33371.1 DNA polymerase III subunit gamma/tau [Leptospiraceae bacterium]HMZ65443.1 DNA polymerase III subunit gamma/tau [Leptospiraceae bacterium]